MGHIARQFAQVATAVLVALALVYLVQDEMGLPAGTIRRDALEGAALFGVALASDALLRGRNKS